MKPCLKCHEFIDSSLELKEMVNNLINDIDKDNRCDESTYNNRLKICDKCESMVNSVCTHCGCFILVRAAMINQSCPKPFNDSWKSI